jgi:hypothetical protein
VAATTAPIVSTTRTKLDLDVDIITGSSDPLRARDSASISVDEHLHLSASSEVVASPLALSEGVCYNAFRVFRIT